MATHSGDADHRFRQADRRFQAMPITLEGRGSIGALVGKLTVEVEWSGSVFVESSGSAGDG